MSGSSSLPRPWTALLAAAAGALVSSSVPMTLSLLGQEQEVWLVALYGLGAVFWLAFYGSLVVTNQWSRLLHPRAEAGAAMVVVSLVYPAQWFVLGFFGVRTDHQFEPTSVLGALSVCGGAALLSWRWDWLLAALMAAWAVVPAWALVAFDWIPVRVEFLASWQVPEAVLAALWLVRARARSA